MTDTLPCTHPDNKPSTSYQRGCRCERCKAWNSGYQMGYSARAGRPVATPVVEHEAACRRCGNTFSCHESALDRQPPELHAYILSVCVPCRSKYAPQVKAYKLDSDLAYALCTATHCESCARPFSTWGRNNGAHVDHDHAHCPNGCRDCIRGFVCRWCNLALGQAEALIVRMDGVEALATYLAKHRTVESLGPAPRTGPGSNLTPAERASLLADLQRRAR